MRRRDGASSGFSLMEILIAITLLGIVFLAVASIDITSRRFFATAKEETWIQDEAKIVMAHMASRIQRGVGDMTVSGDINTGAVPAADNSRGFYILDDTGKLVDSGPRLQIKIDTNGDGRYGGIGVEEFIEYEYTGVVDPDPDGITNSILFYPDADNRTNYEKLADGVVESAIFSFVHNAANPELSIPNRVNITVKVLDDPTQPKSLDNPETTLFSSIILRAMSTN